MWRFECVSTSETCVSTSSTCRRRNGFVFRWQRHCWCVCVCEPVHAWNWNFRRLYPLFSLIVCISRRNLCRHIDLRLPPRCNATGYHSMQYTRSLPVRTSRALFFLCALCWGVRVKVSEEYINYPGVFRYLILFFFGCQELVYQEVQHRIKGFNKRTS